MTTILVLGATGQIGWELQRSLAPLGEVAPLTRGWDSNRACCGDLADADGLRDAVHRIRPSIIVNAAAYTAVDSAESEPERARAVNTIAPGVLSELARKTGALFVHYSTDYVFDGSGDNPWHEDSLTAPLSVYGVTKRDGEDLVRASGAQHLIFRTSWVYAARGRNFARTMLRLAQEREQLSVVDDQWGAPTGADLIADVTAHAIRQVLHRPECAGTYHLSAAGTTSWHGYTRFVIDTALTLKTDLVFKAKDVIAVPTIAFPTLARRPLNSRLNTTRLRDTFGLTLPHWQVGVRRMLAEIL